MLSSFGVSSSFGFPFDGFKELQDAQISLLISRENEFKPEQSTGKN
jgi:hypothetical protein